MLLANFHFHKKSLKIPQK